MKISPHHIVYALLLIVIGYFSFRNKPIKTVDEKVYNQILKQNDSLQKVNASLEEARTIDIKEAAKLKAQIDSIKSTRPQNIKHTRNEVTRLHNSDNAGKLAIIDSILRARKGQH